MPLCGHHHRHTYAYTILIGPWPSPIHTHKRISHQNSYGGHYAPAAGYRVFMGNKSPAPGDVHINLKGIGVGNGLTDPEIQYQYYGAFLFFLSPGGLSLTRFSFVTFNTPTGQMAFNNSYGIQAVDEETFNAMEDAVPVCLGLIHRYAFCQMSGRPKDQSD